MGARSYFTVKPTDFFFTGNEEERFSLILDRNYNGDYVTEHFTLSVTCIENIQLCCTVKVYQYLTDDNYHAVLKYSYRVCLSRVKAD